MLNFSSKFHYCNSDHELSFWMLKYCPEYFEHLAASKSIYSVYQIPKLWLVSIFLIFVYNILPTLFLVILVVGFIYEVVRGALNPH